MADAFSGMNGYGFYTYNYDNNGCGDKYSSGWWFSSCYSACLTCEKAFVGIEGHWNNGTFLNFPDAKMFIKPKIKPKPSNCHDI